MTYVMHFIFIFFTISVRFCPQRVNHETTTNCCVFGLCCVKSSVAPLPVMPPHVVIECAVRLSKDPVKEVFAGCTR